MPQPLAIRCGVCQTIWETESFSTHMQCPQCLALLEIVFQPATTSAALDATALVEMRQALARVMVLQEIERWRARLLIEQPGLSDLNLDTGTPWWWNQRDVWRGIAIASVLGLAYFFAPRPFALALGVAASYAIIVHSGWQRDERLRQAKRLRAQTLPLLMDVPHSEFAVGGRSNQVPFEGDSWLQAIRGNASSWELFQILGWQRDLLLPLATAAAVAPSANEIEMQRAYLHETRPLTG